ncbi:MAG: AMP-dependent synthetase [Pseudomonadales bacterium]|nr:AMP-dependent synthetase [Pseudomonadales bacterium]
MSLLLEAIARHAGERAQAPALVSGDRTLTWQQLEACLNELASKLQCCHGRGVALVGDNGLPWILADLALWRLPVRVVPVPVFFSPDQVHHLMAAAGISVVIGESAAVGDFGAPRLLDEELDLAVTELPVAGADSNPAFMAYEKVTFTSGSTGQPKGVRLSRHVLERTAAAVAQALADVDLQRHLSVLPYATLLENVAGLYAPLLQGVRVHVRPLSQLGFNGASDFNLFVFLQQLQVIQPQALILVPQLLLALVLAAEQGLPLPADLRFIAVGGARVAPDLLRRADALGLPVFEGYGLSECGSVVCLNRPGARRLGTVGKPLDHVRISISDSGEILLAGSGMLGYLGEPPHEGPVATGDLGRVDADGFVHVEGRRKNLLITTYGRNVNPEWVEAELLAQASIAQAAVFGDGLPAIVAVLTPRKGFTWAQVESAVAQVNQQLPVYARVQQLIASREPFSPDNGQATANGRNCRAQIASVYLHPAPHHCITEAPLTMTFFQQLQAKTEAARQHVLSAPVIQAVQQGYYSLEGYTYFLEQAYHHVKHTVPLMMACGGRLPEEKEWVREALREYIEDEYGHQEWILNDLVACGIEREKVVNNRPALAIELMVAFLYDQIQRQNPMAFFGMVMVLEGTSIKLATAMGKLVQQRLALPDAAFSYLYSHGALDQDHFAFFRDLMNRVTDPADQEAIVHSANVVYRLYGDMLRAIPLTSEGQADAAA